MFADADGTPSPDDDATRWGLHWRHRARARAPDPRARTRARIERCDGYHHRNVFVEMGAWSRRREIELETRALACQALAEGCLIRRHRLGRRRIPCGVTPSARAPWGASTWPRIRRRGGRVALKVLVRDLAEDKRFRRRFLRESKLAASLDHPHVVPIVDAGEEDGVLYLAMELRGGRRPA